MIGAVSEGKQGGARSVTNSDLRASHQGAQMARLIVFAVSLLLGELVGLWSAWGDELKAGIAVADITPPPEYRMSGYFSERISSGTHDPLSAKAIYFANGGEQAVLVFCDLVGIP